MSYEYVITQRSPYMLIRARDTAVTLDVYSSAGVQQTATAGTITVRRGLTPTTVISEAVDALGPAASHTLTAAELTLTADADERWQVEWAMTIGGVVHTFVLPAYLTAYDIWPTVLDADLYDEEPELRRFVVAGSSLASFQSQREDSWEGLWRDLYERDISIQLIRDSGALFRPHMHKTLAKIYGAAETSLQDPGYGAKAARYRDMYAASLDQLRLPYDGDENLVADDKDEKPVEGVHDLYAERPRQW